MPFLIVREKNQPDRVFAAEDQEILIGRSRKCDLVLANVSVSRHHLSLYQERGSWELQDLKSGNGTLLNGETAEQASIKNGDQLGVGKFSLVFYENEKAALLAGIDLSELTQHNPMDTNAFSLG